MLQGKVRFEHGALAATAARRAVVAVVLAASVAASATLPAGAGGRAYTPPKKKTYHGVRETGELKHWFRFATAVRAHPAVMQTFHTWGTRPTMAMERWTAARARGMLSVSTATGGEPEEIDPYGIAHGQGDGYPLWLNHDIAAWGHPTYIRLMPEMNGHWNPYSAFNSNGSSRGKRHSTHWFRHAWRRFALIVRGGTTAKINRRLEALDMKPIQARGPYERSEVPAHLPRPKVALMWVPQTEGSPNLLSNGPDDYWPGGRYTDWVGLDMYSIYPNFDGFNRFYRAYRGKPFVVGEYGLWGEDNPSWVKRMFRWARNHRRARLLVYYTTVADSDPFKIWDHPRSRRMMRKILNRKRYPAFAPEANDYAGPTGGVGAGG
ncbi:MAG TPA: hypothetical protein VK920_10380 [Solirubrobacterales bacterium]|nr:hypothetical protein [Solirubrobacterales bacterium]